MADSLSKIGAMLESARELTLEAASSASARLMEETPVKSKDISQLLNGRSERDKLTGMKHVISLMVKGNDTTEFFADVIKNIASTNLETRKLVYTYLLKYADYEPDLALLSINTIQKSLGDKNPLIRSLAIRVISAIRVPAIAPIVLIAIKQCCNDLSPAVRRATCQAIGKCFTLDPSTGGTLVEYLTRMLRDSNPQVLSAAVNTLGRHYSDRLDLLHPSYRAICHALPELDEWSQVMALDLLTRYARLYIPRPKLYERLQTADKFYAGGIGMGKQITDTDELDRAFTATDEPREPRVVGLDADLDLLFRSVSNLLHSRNGAVITASAKLYYYLAPYETFVEYGVVGSLVRLLRSDASVQYLALLNIRTMAFTHAQCFVPFLSSFFVFPSEPLNVAKLKFEILTLLCNDRNIWTVIRDLKFYATASQDPRIVSQAMQAITRCASVASTVHCQRIIKWLLKQVEGDNPVVVSEALTAIRVLVQSDAANHVSTVARLARSLDKPLVAAAKASVLWLVGEFAGIAYDISPDVLRKSLQTFSEEEEPVRYQTLLLAAKVYSYYLDRQNNPETKELDDSRGLDVVPKLFAYATQLARYDLSYDTRDRTRMFLALLDSSINREIGTLILQAPKPNPVVSLRDQQTSLKKIHGDLQVGTTGLALGSSVGSSELIPAWTSADALVNPSVRDEEVPVHTPALSLSSSQAKFVTSSTVSSSYKGSSENHGLVTNGTRRLKEQTLDEFFGEDKGDEEDEEEEDEEEDDEEDDEEEEEEEEDDDEEEDEDEAENDDEEDDDADDDDEESAEDSSENENTAMLR